MRNITLNVGPTRCHVLLENLASYPSPGVRAPTTMQLSHLISQPTSATSVLKKLVQFITYGRRWDRTQQAIVEDRQRIQHFENLAQANEDDVARALRVGLAFELVLPYKISLAFVTKTWTEFRSACLIAIALSAVKNLQMVPALYTEGNTVIVSEMAEWHTRIRDMNIFLKSDALTEELLGEILDNIRKKSAVIVK